ncbi:TLC domain [Mactra antiquata]
MSTEEHIPLDTSFYPVSVVSCISFLLLFKYVCPYMARYMYEDFDKLPIAKQLYWYTSTLSTIHSIIISTMCLYSTLFEPHLIQDPIWAESSIVKCSCAILVGYFLSDSLLSVIFYKHIGDISYLLHHFASVFAYYFVMSHGVYAYFANLRLMAEFSTPWVNNRWFLAVMDKKSSNFYIMNGLILTAVFFLCRMLTMPYCWYMIFSVYGTEKYMLSGASRHVLLFSCAILDMLNIMWFHKLVKGAVKTLQRKDKKSD